MKEIQLINLQGVRDGRADMFRLIYKLIGRDQPFEVL